MDRNRIWLHVSVSLIYVTPLYLVTCERGLNLQNDNNENNREKSILCHALLTFLGRKLAFSDNKRKSFIFSHFHGDTKKI